MLSYHHSFHAGNHADLLKHSAILYLLDYLNIKKEKNWTYLDPFCGQGIYSLDSDDLKKTGEAKAGIERLFERKDLINSDIIKRFMEIQAPYFEKRLYAGSPEIARICGKKNDTLFLNDAQERVFQALKNNFQTCNGATDSPKAIIHNTLGQSFQNQVLPEKNKRGLDLLDPSYEDKTDFDMIKKMATVHEKKFHTGTLAVWYPLLVRRKNETADMIFFLETLAKTSSPMMDFCNIQLELFDPKDFSQEAGSHLYGSGLFVINPPYQFREKMEEAVAELKNILA